MQVNHTLAEQIRSKAQAILRRDVLVADANGRLLAGGEGDFFSADALSAAQSGHDVITDGDQRVHWSPFIYERETVGAFGIVETDNPVDQEVVSLLQGLADVIANQYFLIDRIHSATVVQAEFLVNMLQAPSINSDEIYRQADILQLNLRTTQAVILFHLKGFEKRLMQESGQISGEELRLRILRAADELAGQVMASFHANQDNIVVYAGSDTFVLLKGIGGDNLNMLNTIRFLKEKGLYLAETLSAVHPKSHISIGIGQYYPDLGGLRKSYQDAKLALTVGMKVWGAGRIYHIKEVGMYITLANVSSDRKAELAYQILHPLLKNQQLFDTVQMFLNSDLNLTDAATKLHVHRNTLIYRLDKTKKLINLDPRHFDDALQIKLGLMFYQPA